jgi:hypothetical protein
MKHCDSYNTTYSEDFRFCPVDGKELRPTGECVNQHYISASNGYAIRSNLHIRKWIAAVFAVAIAVGALWAFKASRVAQPSSQTDLQATATEETKTKAKPIVKPGSVSSRRVTSARGALKPDESLDTAGDLAQQAHVQQLVATGYRNLQQRDYESARDAFEEALEIDPHSIPARKGLNATKTAESVEGVAGVFRL